MSEPAHRLGPFSPHVSPEGARLREAMIELALERGLDGVDAELLCARAGVEPTAFFRTFDGVGDCALRVYLANIAEFDRNVFAAVDATEGWPARLRVAAYAAARHVRDRPHSTRFDMLAMLTAGDLAQAHRDRYVRRLIDLIDEGRRQPGAPAGLGRATAEGVFGSIYQLLARALQGGRDLGPPEDLVPQLMYIAVRPYLGEEAALEELSIDPPQRIPG